MSRSRSVDKIFLGLAITLTIVGILVFLSASFGILPKNESKFFNVLLNQLLFGLGGGIIAALITARVNYKIWRKYSFYIFLGALVLTALVFIPGLGFKHAGALRWISIGSFSFQPVEFLKIGFIIYFAAWLSWVKDRAENFKLGILPFLIFIGLVGAVLFKQPDMKSFILIVLSSLGMFFISGVRLKNILILSFSILAVLGFTVLERPYLLDRVMTFLEPSRDPLGSSYQLQQGLIAIGSGGLFGRGFGQSVQKFSYLPEPQGDSIFAVIGEEFGFIGSTFVILLFTAFILRGLRIANRAPDLFGRLLSGGIVILIGAQAFLNIASVTGVFPLTGVPLPFISHGGTSLLITLAAVGILLNISKYERHKI